MFFILLFWFRKHLSIRAIPHFLVVAPPLQPMLALAMTAYAENEALGQLGQDEPASG